MILILESGSTNSSIEILISRTSRSIYVDLIIILSIINIDISLGSIIIETENASTDKIYNKKRDYLYRA